MNSLLLEWLNLSAQSGQGTSEEAKRRLKRRKELTKEITEINKDILILLGKLAQLDPNLVAELCNKYTNTRRLLD